MASGAARIEGGAGRSTARGLTSGSRPSFATPTPEPCVATASLTKRREMGRRNDLGTCARRASGFAARTIVDNHAGGLALGWPCGVSLRSEPRADNQSRGIEFFAELLRDAMAAIEIA